MQTPKAYLTKEGWKKDWEETPPKVRRGIEDIINLILPSTIYYSRLVGESAILFGMSTLISGLKNCASGSNKLINKEDIATAGCISLLYLMYGMLKDGFYAFRNKGDLYDMFHPKNKNKDVNKNGKR